MVGASLMCRPKARLLIAFKGHETVGEINRLQGMILDLKTMQTDHVRIHTFIFLAPQLCIDTCR